MIWSYRVGSQDLQVWFSGLQQLGHHVQETLHKGFDALRVTGHQQLVQSLHGYHHIPAYRQENRSSLRSSMLNHKVFRYLLSNTVIMTKIKNLFYKLQTSSTHYLPPDSHLRSACNELHCLSREAHHTTAASANKLENFINTSFTVDMFFPLT